MKLLYATILITIYSQATIREYHDEIDYRAILSIVEASFDSLSDEGDHETAHDVIKEYLNFPGSHFFVYSDKDKLCGFIDIIEQTPFLLDKDKNKKIGVIGLLAIDKAYQKKGFGKKLISFACDWFAHKNITRVALYVHKDNKAAQKFYQKVGFRIVSDINDPLVQGFKKTVYYKTDDIFIIDL